MEELQPERDPGRSPLFQVMLVLQNMEREEIRLPGLKADRFRGEVETAKFDLLLVMSEGPEGLTGELSYARDLYEKNTIERLLGHWRVVLERMVQDPEARTEEVSLLTPAEHRQVVVDWNRTYVEHPRVCVHELFEMEAQRRPLAVAVEYEGQRLSYRELNERANQLGHYLRKQGVGQETRVGVQVERSLEMIVGVLGILKAGGAYVPLDPGYPAERLAQIVKDAQVELLLTRGQTFGARELTCVDLLQWEEKIGGEPKSNPESGNSQDNLAYVIYTSGSTGIPRGVGVEHRSIVRLVRGANYVDLSEESVILQFAPLAFDASTFEIWGSLLNGGRLVVCAGQPLSLQELGERVSRGGVNVMWLTAGLFHQMVDDELESLQGVRQLLAGGDVLNPVQVSRALTALPGARVINGYGPTENTTFTCCYGLGQEEIRTLEGSVPIGRPISNTQAYVLDRHMQAMPEGVPGELYTGGGGLARGYLNSAALTAERFVPNPFSDGEGERLYRTGDSVRWRGDGTIEFLGRLDHQVKVRGYRIELGEIETALLSHGGVEQAVVVVRGEGVNKSLAAYVVVRGEGEEVGSRELVAYLRDRLPEYMVPPVIMQLEKLPLTPNGKVDRRALPEPGSSGGGPEQDNYEGPKTAEEEVLSGIFGEVLKVERVGVEDNFFELGGHSLLATQVMSRIRNVFNAELPLRVLFESSTVRELAEQVREARGAGRVARPRMERAARERDVPLSYAQQRMWFLNQLEPGERGLQHAVRPAAARRTG